MQVWRWQERLMRSPSKKKGFIWILTEFNLVCSFLHRFPTIACFSFKVVEDFIIRYFENYYIWQPNLIWGITLDTRS